MSLHVGFIRHYRPDDPYHAVITGAESSAELHKMLTEAGSDEQVEAFMIVEGPLADILSAMASVNGEQDDSLQQQLEALLSRAYKIGRGRAMTDAYAIMEIEEARKQEKGHPAIRKAYHNE